LSLRGAQGSNRWLDRDRKQTTVWLAPHRRNASGHAAEKPLLCMTRPMLNHTAPGDAIYDPFVAGGERCRFE
jgi:DNA modification methylase